MKVAIAILALSVSACGTLEPDAQAAPKSSSKWRFEAKGGVIAKVVVAPDGDLIASGPIQGAANFGGQKLESEDNAVWVARFGSKGSLKWAKLVDPPKKQYTSDFLRALAVAADGSIRVHVARSEAPFLRSVSITADGATQTVNAFLPDIRTMASSVLANGDSLVSAEPRAKDKCKGAMLQRLQSGGKRVWSVCNAKVDVGGLNLTAVVADGRSASCAHEWIGAFSTKGKRLWEAKHPEELWCSAIALFESGNVLVVFDGEPTMSVTVWKANGNVAWTKKCTELLKGRGLCLLDAVAVRGNDAVFAVRNADTSLIVVLDGTTGAVKKTYPLGIDAAFEPVVATDSEIVFGTTSPSSMTIEGIDR